MMVRCNFGHIMYIHTYSTNIKPAVMYISRNRMSNHCSLQVNHTKRYLHLSEGSDHPNLQIKKQPVTVLYIILESFPQNNKEKTSSLTLDIFSKRVSCVHVADRLSSLYATSHLLSARIHCNAKEMP